MSKKQLLLLRHAKSSWRNNNLGDHERPLNPRGRNAAASMGRHLADSDLIPDLTLCSTAVRARSTWELAAKAQFEMRPDCEYTRDLYHATPSDLIRRICEVPNTVGRLLIVGHNPSLELLAHGLAGPSSDEALVIRMQEKYPTAGLAVFEVAAQTWKGMTPEASRLIAFDTPASLASVEA